MNKAANEKWFRDALEDVKRAQRHAKDAADALRAEYARRLLSDAFPAHATAVFARNWDEEEPGLIQLLSDDDAVPDLYVRAESSARPELTDRQRAAIIRSEASIAEIGPDDDILRLLEGGQEDHGDWVEFDLTLAQPDGDDE